MPASQPTAERNGKPVARDSRENPTWAGPDSATKQTPTGLGRDIRLLAARERRGEDRREAGESRAFEYKDKERRETIPDTAKGREKGEGGGRLSRLVLNDLITQAGQWLRCGGPPSGLFFWRHHHRFFGSQGSYRSGVVWQGPL